MITLNKDNSKTITSLNDVKNIIATAPDVVYFKDIPKTKETSDIVNQLEDIGIRVNFCDDFVKYLAT